MSRKTDDLLLERKCRRCGFQPNPMQWPASKYEYHPKERLIHAWTTNHSVHDCPDGGIGILDITGARDKGTQEPK